MVNPNQSTVAGWHERNLHTYNSSAENLAKYFQGIGPRNEDIERGLELAQAGTDGRVVEIGCGDGRDATEIIERVAWYEGVDPSSGLLSIARNRLPEASFIEADAISYNYPDNIDVIFAFASLLHVTREDMPRVFEKGSQALREGGIYYLSLKERPEYVEEVKADEYGERMFYYYNVELIKELAGMAFQAVYESHQTIGSTDWFTLAMKKTKPE